MPLNLLGVLDLSIVTDRLIQLLNSCVQNWPLWAPAQGEVTGEVNQFAINVTGAAPDTVRDLGGCQLSVYLFHVTQDPYQRNSPVVGPRAQTIPTQPLSLNLYYLLSAYAGGDYHQEQQAMSIALRCFHQNPIVQASVPIPVQPQPAPLQPQTEEFTLTMEVETLDTLSRLWQSITSSMRLAAIYKVSVVFLTPPVPPTPLAQEVEQMGIGLSANPTTFPFEANGQLFGTFRRVTYTSPLSSAAVPKTVTYDSSVATVASGQTLTLLGAGLSDGSGNPNPTAKRVYLVTPAGAEQEVTGWIVPDPNPTPPPATTVLDSRLSLLLPSPPATIPDPGLYQLRVGADTGAGDPVTYRSNSVPLGIAAGVTGLPLAPNPPILTAFTVSGIGFLSGKTDVLLGAVPLHEGPLLAGNFQIVGGTTINFQPPSNLPHGLYAVRVRVNQVESDPSWWASL